MLSAPDRDAILRYGRILGRLAQPDHFTAHRAGERLEATRSKRRGIEIPRRTAGGMTAGCLAPGAGDGTQGRTSLMSARRFPSRSRKKAIQSSCSCSFAMQCGGPSNGTPRAVSASYASGRSWTLK